jgi:uncharacterized protein (DUF427 family)
MSLTSTAGPLGPARPETVNYQLTGPAHLLYAAPFPRRVRARFAGETVLDTTAGLLLHETNLRPQLYVPEADLRHDLLTDTDLSTHCPFKGDASYRSIVVPGADRVAENAVWAYRSPKPGSSWLAGYAALYWDRVDEWLDEDEPVRFGGLPDPFHRVDVRRSSRHVRVLQGDRLIAESRAPLVLSETGLPNRYYLPRTDVRAPLLPSATGTVCAYKGRAAYWSVAGEGDAKELTDAVWGYPEPLDGVGAIAGLVSFLHDDLVITED